ncbi:transmembrane protein 176 [Cyprinodon tularosa]|uniref:transmembrane protein 176 n=1 Tax=Cyprinodon tularosa TaxID=77115 RepID=UPI0018E2199A|nr:transmembrane protein 176 [Cyprinodon tularosa]XP_038125587.1 transmembrane protein 176 [Cyprinodon tularosa]
MAVSVTRDLKVEVLEDENKVRLSNKQEEMRLTIQRGDPKCMGVSQVMLGLMVIFYSLPLLSSEATDVVNFGVPWWTGVTFIAAGSIAMILDRICTMKFLQVCLIASVATLVVSVVAVIIYCVDLGRYPQFACNKTEFPCDPQYYLTRFNRGIKSSLLFFTLVQTAISAVSCWLLLRQRNSFQYSVISQPASTRNEYK